MRYITHLSLKQKILFSVAIALSLVISILSWTCYSSQRELLLQSSFEQVKKTSQQQAERIGDWLSIRQHIVSSLEVDTQENLRQKLLQVYATHQFESVYYGSNNGEMIDTDLTIDYSSYDPRTRDWYNLGKQKNESAITKPYVDIGHGSLVVTVVNPVNQGVFAADVLIKKLVDDINNMSIPANGFAILIHKDGTVIAYKDSEKVMKPVSTIDNNLNRDLFSKNLQKDQFIAMYFDNDKAEKLVWPQDIPKSDWELIIVLDKAALEAPLRSLLLTNLGISTVVLLLSIIGISWLVNILLVPLNNVSQALEHIANGNGDLTQRIEVQNKDEVGMLANSFNRFVGSQHQLISHVRQLATELDAEAERSLASTQMSVNELQRQQQEIAMVATAVTEMASATNEIAVNAENTATAAQQSAASSFQGKELVDKTRSSINILAKEVTQATEVIEELSHHAQAISSILSTIQSIAEQTNLLALNAAIEAARAGEQGRGFAVVADEVRVLSHRTQNSTQEVHTTIETLQRTTAKAVALMESSQALAGHSVKDVNAAAMAIEEITMAVNIISDMAGQIATAAEEQTQVTDEITQNTVAIKDVTDEITTAATAELAQARELKSRANDLTAQVATFIL